MPTRYAPHICLSPPLPTPPPLLSTPLRVLWLWRPAAPSKRICFAFKWQLWRLRRRRQRRRLCCNCLAATLPQTGRRRTYRASWSCHCSCSCSRCASVASGSLGQQSTNNSYKKTATKTNETHTTQRALCLATRTSAALTSQRVMQRILRCTFSVFNLLSMPLAVSSRRSEINQEGRKTYRRSATERKVWGTNRATKKENDRKE